MRWPLGLVILATAVLSMGAEPVPLSPAALAASSDGGKLYLACATAKRVLCFDLADRKVSGSIAMAEWPSGVVLVPHQKELVVTCGAPESKVCIVDLVKQKILATVPAGHTTRSPVISPNGKVLYVCNQFNNDLSVIDLVSLKEIHRIGVQREPIAADITKDGKYLLVANHLPAGRADADHDAAVVSVIDLAAGKIVKELGLPDGSGELKDIRVSPDGKYAVLTHIVASFYQATTRIEFGWINANALTIIDLSKMEVLSTVLLDMPHNGAANPWGVAWSSDGGATVAVAHSGTHEVSIIDFKALLAGLASASDRLVRRKSNAILSYESSNEIVDSLPFLVGAHRRIPLPKGDLGPRSIVIVSNTVYTANYFSDTLSAIDLSHPEHGAESIPLGPKQEVSTVRKGEFYFHDARICLEGWQSCSSCHPDGRADGLNWDLLNDGIGNPKNTKSLLLAHKTPPAMALGVRESAEAAVRAGIKHILFTDQPEDVAAAIDEYLKSLKPVPSPHLVHGKLSKAAARGERIFSRAGCAVCHPPGLFTDLRPYDVGTLRSFDRATDKFYTPTLVELWRTAPYLHDGSAATVRDVLTTRNPHDQHGKTSNLSDSEIDDLCAYLLSL